MFAIITGIPSGSLSRGERGEGHQKEGREMTGERSLRFSALCWLASLTARKEWLAWAYPLPRCSCTLRLFRFFPRGKRIATYAKLPSFYASILSFYANPNTDLSVIKTILSSISFFHEYVFRGISVLQAILLDSNSFGSLPSLEVCPDIILISRIFKKVLRLGGIPELMYPGILWKGFTTMPNYRRKGFAGRYDESWLTATNSTVPFSCRGLK